jgi:hypothetical protein
MPPDETKQEPDFNHPKLIFFFQSGDLIFEVHPNNKVICNGDYFGNKIAHNITKRQVIVRILGARENKNHLNGRLTFLSY